MAVVIARNIPYTVKYTINDKSLFQALIIKVKNLDLVIIYQPPQTTTIKKIYAEINNNLQPPYIIVGDFNCHHTTWGSPINDRKGNILTEITENMDWILLNDGSITRMGKNHQTNSHIDLAFSSTDIASEINWKMENETFGSDHLLMDIQINPNFVDVRRRTTTKIYNTKKADWTKYSILIKEERNKMTQINIETIIKTITKTANQCIKRLNFNTNYKKIPAPWWDQECDDLIQKRAEATREFRLQLNNYALNKLLAIKKRIKKAFYLKKINTFTKYCASYNRDTSPTIIWNNIKKFKRAFVPQSNSIPLTEEQEIEFINYYFPPMATLYRPITSFPNTEDLITMEELRYVLKESNTAPGMDGINHEMIFHLPDEILNDLLNVYNDFIKKK